MNSNEDIVNNIINAINVIFDNLFTSIDSTLYKNLDNLIFIDSSILNDNFFYKIFGTSASNGILLISNSLLFGILIYYSIKIMMSNFTSSRIESPTHFIFKMIIFGICMNCSFFIIEQILNINSNICLAIRSIGEDIFKHEINFSNLIESMGLSITETKDIFSMDGLIKGTFTTSLVSLVFSYAIRYIMLKIFVLITPFAFLSLMTQNTEWFFKSWCKNIFSLLFIQIVVDLILLILFSMNIENNNLLYKLIYIGGIYALIRANSIAREFAGGISTSVQSNLNMLKMIK